MSSKIIAMSLFGALLVGCGSSDSSNKVSQFDLTDYEGRTVNTDTLAGTWVAVGTGTYKYSDANDTDYEELALKEYFVITGTSETGYEKQSCEGNYSDQVQITGNHISFGVVSGTVVDNSAITAILLDSYEGNSYSEESKLNLTAVKISDEIAAIGSFDGSTNSGNFERGLYCYQQVNGKGSYNGESYSSTYFYSTQFQIDSFSGAFDYTNIYSFNPFINLNSIYEGESVSFNVTSSTALSETVIFSASDNSDSVTGTITVQLPAE